MPYLAHDHAEQRGLSGTVATNDALQASESSREEDDVMSNCALLRKKRQVVWGAGRAWQSKDPS